MKAYPMPHKHLPDIIRYKEKQWIGCVEWQKMTTWKIGLACSLDHPDTGFSGQSVNTTGYDSHAFLNGFASHFDQIALP